MGGDLLTFADWRQMVLDWSALWPVWALLFFVAVLHLHRANELHHGYYGLALVVPVWWPWWVRGLGLVLLIDDAIQHAMQCWQPAWRSPIHKLYQATCGALHRKVVAWWVTR